MTGFNSGGLDSWIKHAKVIKDSIEEALRCDPHDGEAHYIIGVLYFNVLKLTWQYKLKLSSMHGRDPGMSGC